MLKLSIEKMRRVPIKMQADLMAIVEKRTKEMNNLRDAILQWSGEFVEFRDDTSGKHIEHVRKYMKILINAAKKEGPYIKEISEWDVNAVLLASALHDVGKIKIPDNILLKKGRLSPKEYEKMKNHCLYGKQLLESLGARLSGESFLEYAKSMAYYHHEKWDGTGYPEQLKGDKIPLEARMMALVDVYDAMVSVRPYKPACSHNQALKTIQKERGIHFDPVLVDLFVKSSDEVKKIEKG